MRKTVVAVFAHPDDEAFGPGGTLAKFAKTHDVYIICATCGERGQNSLSKAHKKLSDIRIKELLSSAEILGVKKVFFLNYKDGSLSNNIYHELASKIEEKLLELAPSTIITFEERGVSGHIDHITISFVTTFVAKKLKQSSKLYYYYFTQEISGPMEKDYFIYFPKGHKASKADMKVDIKDVWDTKIKAMKAHKSQIHDANRLIGILEKLPKEEHFLKFRH